MLEIDAIQSEATESVESKKETGTLDNPAKILEIGPYPPPYNGWSTRIAAVKDGLGNAGHICAILNIGENRRIHSPDYECVRNGWEYMRKLIRYAWSGYSFHIHTNGDSTKAFVLNLIAYFVSLCFVRRPVLTFHAGTDQIYFPREKSRLMVPLLKFLFAFSKLVICNDEKVKECIVNYGVNPEKVIPILPFSRQYLEPTDQELDKNLEEFLTNHSPVVLTYVEWRSEYDLDCLFGVCRKLAQTQPRCGLIVVGATREREEIGELLKAADIAECSLHLGAVDRNIFISILQKVSVYLRSAKTEGTSASIREALHFGIPVVANHAKSQPEGVFGYPWGESAAMFETLEKAIANSQAMREAGTHKDSIEVPDTVSDEVDVLVSCALGAASIHHLSNATCQKRTSP